jgi:single-strand DNA-binding protein
VTEWHNLVAFNRTAEVVRDYVGKGTQLLIEGKIQTRCWDDKESGQRKYRTEILVNELTLLGGKPDGSRSSYGGRSTSTAPSYAERGPASGQYEYADAGISDDELPF